MLVKRTSSRLSGADCHEQDATTAWLCPGDA